MFENAIRKKYRFSTNKGEVSVEDLWDMPLINQRTNFDLDTVARSLAKSLRESAEDSFVVVTSSKTSVLEEKLEIVKHIIKVKMEEAKEKEEAKMKESQRDTIRSIIETKKLSALGEKTIEELEAML